MHKKLVGVKAMMSLLSCSDAGNVVCEDDERLPMGLALGRSLDGDDWESDLVLWGHRHHNGQSVGKNVYGRGSLQWNHLGFGKWDPRGCRKGNRAYLGCGGAASNEHGRWGR